MDDSNGTLILNLGALEGGTLTTLGFAQKLGKPGMLVQLDGEVTNEIVGNVFGWLRQHGISTLNVAGPRESKRPGIYGMTMKLLAAVHAENARESSRQFADG